MEITFQNTRNDYKRFIALNLKQKFLAKILLYLILATVIGVFAAGKPIDVSKFFIWALVALFLFFGIYFLMPYLIAKKRMNKVLTEDSDFLHPVKMEITDEGLSIEKRSTTVVRNWKSFISANASQEYLSFILLDKCQIIIPKRHFSSDAEALNFFGLAQAKINQTPRPFSPIKVYEKSPYWIGLFCFIPVFGAFVGLVLVLYGLLKYKDKWLTLIGVAGIGFTIFVYTFLFNFGFKSNIVANGFSKISEDKINVLVKHIELYKLSNGIYPDSLNQLLNADKNAPIYDDVLMVSNAKNTLFHYTNNDSKYLLFGCGPDRKPNTKDDVYPSVTEPSNSSLKLNYIKKVKVSIVGY